MPGQKPTRVQSRDQMVGFHGGGESGAERMLDELTRRTEAQQGGARSLVIVDLEIGDNRVIHNLGRAPRGANLTPTVASAAFAWALGEVTDTIAIVEVVGTDQPGAAVEFY